MAYLPFPSNWPLFTPKDKIGDWFEAYASLMELNVWMNTRIQSAEYNKANGDWVVQVERGGEPVRRLKPRHVIMCTGTTPSLHTRCTFLLIVSQGHAGEPKIPSFPGQSDFKGAVYHGSQHQDASLSGGVTGKRVIVVGTGNSGHDIAQNFYENGADVTMLQRRSTYVISAKTGLFMLHEGLYDEGGPPTEDADVYGQSLPIPVQFALNVAGTNRIAAAEKENIEGLTKAGFRIDFGEDGSGIYRKYITRGGGYYIDVGCSQLIIDGKIKLQQSPDGIKGFEPHALVLADGTKMDADVVVLATGYDNMVTSARKILGDKVAERCKDVWDLDEEGEVNAVCRLPVQTCLCDANYLVAIDVETQRSSSLLVHGRQSRIMPNVLKICCTADQGYRGGNQQGAVKDFSHLAKTPYIFIELLPYLYVMCYWTIELLMRAGFTPKGSTYLRGPSRCFQCTSRSVCTKMTPLSSIAAMKSCRVRGAGPITWRSHKV